MMADLGLWLLVAGFVAWEMFAHFVARNRQIHTLSNRIWWLEKRHWWIRLVVAAACLVLLTHLTLQIP